MKERLHYIDLAKGILILMVAYGHIGYQLCHNDGFDNIYMEKLSEISNVWVAFFMPAFFVVTGMCSNFCKQWKPFVVSQFKSLIVPAFTLALIVNILGVLLADKEFYLGVKVFLKGNSYWFLFSLFVAKMVYYKLNKYVRSLKHIVMSTLVLYLIFVLINNFLPQIPNYWCWIHALGLVPFLALGQVLRKYDVLNRRRVLFLSGGGIFNLVDYIFVVRHKDTKDNRGNLRTCSPNDSLFDFISYRSNCTSKIMYENRKYKLVGMPW